MKKAITFLALLLFWGCTQSNQSASLSGLKVIFKDQKFAEDIDEFINLSTIQDSIDKIKGYSVIKRYYYLVSQYNCKNHAIIQVTRIPFINRSTFNQEKYLGYYSYKGNLLIFESDQINKAINCQYLIKEVPLNVPDENSIEGQSLMGDDSFIAYTVDEKGNCQLTCQNPIDFLRNLENDTMYFGCY